MRFYFLKKEEGRLFVLRFFLPSFLFNKLTFFELFAGANYIRRRIFFASKRTFFEEFSLDLPGVLSAFAIRDSLSDC